MRLTIKNFLVIFSAALVLITALLGFKFWSFFSTPLLAKDQPPVTFLFAPGDSAKKAALILKQQNLLRYPQAFLLLARLSGAEYDLKAGEYVIEPGMTLLELMRKMVKGDALRHAFTVVEGWTFAQVVAALNSNQYITHTIHNLTTDKIMEKIGHSGEFPEGRFAPDTYLFSGKMVDTEILINAYRLLQKQLQTAWQNRDQNLPYHCPYEALIVASLIEKETAVAAEKSLISGVILRRLVKGMLLQVDPSVIYGLGHKKFSGKLSKADLAKDTPYNTYLHKGLPPTPIAMPGKDSIVAALHPAAGTSWYYVAKGDGTHEFSDSLKEQTKSVKKYLLHK